MRQEIAHRVFVGIADRIRAPACRRHPASAAAPCWRRARLSSVVCPLAVCRGRRELVGVGFAGGRIELEGHASRRMVHAVADGHHREHQQRADLNDVDGDVHRRRASDAAMRDVGNAERKDHRDHHHEQRAGVRGAHGVGPQRSDHVTAENSRHRHHHPGIDPVVQVRGPADDELREPRIPPVLVMIQKRLFGEVVGTAGSGIELGQFRITNRRGQTKQRGEQNADPHRRRRRAFPRLAEKREP